MTNNNDIKTTKRRTAPMKVTEEKIKKCLEEGSMTVTDVAKKLNASYAYVYEKLHKDKELIDLLNKNREVMVDTAEEQLKDKIENGVDWAVKFGLGTLGRRRGYQEREQTNVNIFQGEKQMILVANGESRDSIEQKTSEGVESSDRQDNE